VSSLYGDFGAKTGWRVCGSQVKCSYLEGAAPLPPPLSNNKYERKFRTLLHSSPIYWSSFVAVVFVMLIAAVTLANFTLECSRGRCEIEPFFKKLPCFPLRISVSRVCSVFCASFSLLDCCIELFELLLVAFS